MIGNVEHSKLTSLILFSGSQECGKYRVTRGGKEELRVDPITEGAVKKSKELTGEQNAEHDK